MIVHYTDRELYCAYVAISVGIEECYSRSQERTHDGKPGSLGSSIPYVGRQGGCSCMNTNSTDVLPKSIAALSDSDMERPRVFEA